MSSASNPALAKLFGAEVRSQEDAEHMLNWAKESKAKGGKQMWNGNSYHLELDEAGQVSIIHSYITTV